jgi:hypothetical protein
MILLLFFFLTMKLTIKINLSAIRMQLIKIEHRNDLNGTTEKFGKD